jgi:nucleotide-binding universal stress UspA family protein
MENVWVLAALWVGLALVATLLAIWFRISTALTEIVVGTVAQLIIGAFVVQGGLGAKTGWIVNTGIVVGHPAEQLIHRTETEQADLIIVGRRGTSLFQKIMLGSTSERVLRYAHCPVLLVK